jgi:hypothetical protein
MLIVATKILPQANPPGAEDRRQSLYCFFGSGLVRLNVGRILARLELGHKAEFNVIVEEVKPFGVNFSARSDEILSFDESP